MVRLASLAHHWGMRNIFKLKWPMMALVIGLSLVWPALSYADWHGHDWHHRRSFVGCHFSVWPNNYYYYAPYYPPGYEVFVSQPVYDPFATYYLDQHYVYDGYTYQPIAPPVTVIQQPVRVDQPPVIVDNQLLPADLFTINIPNDNGGYTAVALKKSGSGYIGPQGEFYPQFPSVAQLKVIYSKRY